MDAEVLNIDAITSGANNDLVTGPLSKQDAEGILPRDPESLERCPALVLNADYRPLSYFPLSLWSWQDAVKAAFQDRVVIVAEYERVVRSSSFEMQLPSVIALKEFINMNRRPAFTRFNVFLRDGFKCQYCRSQFPTEHLTFDHVIPRSRGGVTSWANVVTSCQSCNLKKSNKSLKDSGLKIAKVPMEPHAAQLQRMGQSFPPNYLHHTWQDYLYWDSELER